MKNKIKLINNIAITSFDSYELVVYSIEELKKEKKYVVANYMYWVPFVKSKKNLKYVKALSKSDYIFPDGVGLLTYIKLLHGKKCMNLNGTDLNPFLIEYFNDNKYSISLYGSTKEIIDKCAIKLLSRGISIDYSQDGYSELDWNRIKNDTVLFVGMGSPLQEIWVANNIETIKDKNLIVITVGGYFDFEAEYYKRAPLWVRKLKSEWIYRILDNPKLQIPKYVNNLYFPIYIVTDFFKMKKRRKKDEIAI